MLPAIILKDATLADLETVVAIYNSTIASKMVTADTEHVSAVSRLEWFHEHTPGKRPLWIAETSTGSIIGWISFQSFYGRPAYDATAEISIYLAPEQRGKGFGDQLLKLALRKAPGLKMKNLLGYIFAHNHPSIKLFSKNGFNIWGTLPRIANLDGTECDLLIFGKRLV